MDAKPFMKARPPTLADHRTTHRQHRQTRFIFICLWALFLLSSDIRIIAEATEADNIDCPGPDEAFVTTCSGGEEQQQQQQQQQSDPPHPTVEAEILFDESNLVDEVLLEDAKKNDSPSRKADNSDGNSATNNDTKNGGGEQNFYSGEPGFCDATEDGSTMHQLKQTTDKLIQRYYDPLPKQGKCAIGTICGFTASRLALGVANRFVRLAGATWVLAEVLHSSGYCDEAKCVPEEARPWVQILRRTLIKQCIKVRMFARRVWDEDRIHKIAQRDGVASGGFAAGAFIGFIV